MPEVLQELPSIESLLVADSCQPCFLEVFAGKAVLTMAMVAMSVPCAKPWDVVYGEQFDVLKHGGPCSTYAFWHALPVHDVGKESAAPFGRMASGQARLVQQTKSFGA